MLSLDSTIVAENYVDYVLLSCAKISEALTCNNALLACLIVFMRIT